MSRRAPGPQRRAATTTVVVACHSNDRFAALARAVRSVLGQDARPAAVVVAVDHNPALAARVRGALPEARVVLAEGPHRGASATRNAGAALADGDLVAFLDDDEVAGPDWLGRLLEPFDDPAVVGTGGRYAPVWQAGRPGWFPDEFGWAVGSAYTGMPTRRTPVRNVWSGNMAVRTAAFARVGGFRAGFGKTGGTSRPEDTDLCIRVAHATGGHWVYVPDAVIDHDVPADRSTFGFFLRRCFAEGRGKVELARALRADAAPDLLDGDASAEGVTGDPLDAERGYLTRTLPAGVLRHVRAGGLGRAGAIVAGAAAAGAGAGAALVGAGSRP